MLAVKQENPEYKITSVFQNPNAPMKKGSKTKYSDWCENHGIEWRNA
ncbi:hypothetical protein K6301_03895 [Shinella oryzae]|nr:hypothetical protein K6301_03895 [Shinella oryzae]